MNIKIVYFTSPDCSICVNQMAILNELNSEMDIEFDNHLITTAFDKALTYGIKSAPALVFLYDEKPQVVKTGFHTKHQIKEIIDMIT
jgi:predicted DsbA family dithiol-disulfide isomerase